MNAVTAHDQPATPSACENCGTPLQGHYCHHCGQSLINPIRHAGHALEEVFESFWHLDGRVFRTLRDLLVPGRTAIAYIAGHRARYIAPLRLFVVLSVLTFFVGQMTVDMSGADVQFGDDDAISKARTVAQVEQVRDRLLKDIQQAETAAARVPGANAGLIVARARIQGEAASRIAELQRGTRAARPGPGDPGSGAPPVVATPAAEAPLADASAASDKPKVTFFDGKTWDAQTNPVTVPWLPAFANRWLNQKIGRALANAPRLKDDPELRKRVILGSVPTALFVLMPVFALLLKLAYIFGKRRLYLEHLVVALYSHAFLLLALLAVFVMVGLEHALAPHWAGAGRVFGWLEVAAWWGMPIYLLIMQKRVYGQGWTMTSLKYFVLGTAYMVLVTFAAVLAGLAGLAKL